MHLGVWALRLWVWGLRVEWGIEAGFGPGLGAAAGAGRAGPRSRVGRPGLRSAGRGRWSGSPGGTASPLHNSAGGAGGRRAAQEAGRGAPELPIGDKARPPGAPRAARAGAQPAPPATDMMFPQSRHSVRGTPRSAPRSSPCTPGARPTSPALLTEPPELGSRLSPRPGPAPGAPTGAVPGVFAPNHPGRAHPTGPALHPSARTPEL